jgi:two-component system chemotaxis response regulator CheV
VTAVTELKDSRLVMMLDVEKILADTSQVDDSHLFASLAPLDKPGRTVFYADDSSVARKQIERTLEGSQRQRHRRHQRPPGLGRTAEDRHPGGDRRATGSDYVQLVLTDVEMPEMDGYVLTKNVKSDPRFAGIPVLMHSSLSSDANRQLGLSVGVDEYVPKFEPHRLAEVLNRLLK